MDKEELLKAVWKRAVGYVTTETVEESSLVDGELRLTKQRVTSKEVQPDMTAAKLLLDGFTEEDYLSDEELEKEKKRLIRQLMEEEKNATDKPEN